METDSVYIGFAFGIRPDSSPGPCNELMARQIDAAIQHPPGLLCVQSETSDAMVDQGLPAAAWQPQVIASLKLIGVDDIPDPNALAPYLSITGNPGITELRNSLACWNTIETEANTARKQQLLVDALNSLLEQPDLYRRFAGIVVLPNLKRSKPCGVEERILPASGPGGRANLSRFQALRVNRLIMESIVPELASSDSGTGITLLRRMSYVNTEDVARKATSVADPRSLKVITVFAQPEHKLWCFAKTAQEWLNSLYGLTGSNRKERIWVEPDRQQGGSFKVELPTKNLPAMSGVSVSAVAPSGSLTVRGLGSMVTLRYYAGPPIWDLANMWDSGSAQHWVRSQQNWIAYSNA